MKHTFLLFALFAILPCFSQTDYAKVPMDTPEEIKAAEKDVLDAATIVLAIPTAQRTKQSIEAELFILTWMEKTEHTFILSQAMLKCCKKDDMLGVYLAALAKGKLGYNEKHEVNAVKEFIKYVNNPNMGIKKTGAIKKLIKANDSGDLSYYTS